jgi:hypothetical protein
VIPKPKVDMVLGMRKVYKIEDKIEYALKEDNELILDFIAMAMLG